MSSLKGAANRGPVTGDLVRNVQNIENVPHLLSYEKPDRQVGAWKDAEVMACIELANKPIADLSLGAGIGKFL